MGSTLTPEQHASLVAERSVLLQKLANVEALQKNNPSSPQLHTERNQILQRLQQIDNKVGFYYAAQDASNPRTGI
jgi:hypothetical protein